MNLRNTFLTILFTSVFLTQNINISYSQYDSIKGYNDIEFGESFESAVKKLKEKNIYIDTSKNSEKNLLFSEYVSLIKYTQLIKLSIDYEKTTFQLDVKLFFDRNNKNKFYEGVFEIKKFASNIEYPQKVFNEFFKIYLEKYGLEYDEYNCLDSIDSWNIIDGYSFLSKTLTYIWQNKNSQLNLKLDVRDLFEHTFKSDNIFLPLYSSNLKESGGYYYIKCKYEDIILSTSFYMDALEKWRKEENIEREKLKEKF